MVSELRDRPQPQSRHTAIQYLRDSSTRLWCRNLVEQPKAILQQTRDRLELGPPEDTRSAPHDTNISTPNRSGATTRPRTPQKCTAEIRHRSSHDALDPPHQMALPSLPPTEPLVQLRPPPRRHAMAHGAQEPPRSTAPPNQFPIGHRGVSLSALPPKRAWIVYCSGVSNTCAVAVRQEWNLIDSHGGFLGNN